MTAIELTLPPVPADAAPDDVDESVRELAEMNSDDWTTLLENGLGDGSPVQLEFAYSAANEETATMLAEWLQIEAGYDARAVSPSGEHDEWSVKGETSEATVTEEGLHEWVRRMAAGGIRNGDCVLDGWSALL